MPGAVQNPNLVLAQRDFCLIITRYNKWVKVAGWENMWMQWKNFGQRNKVFSRASNAGIAKKRVRKRLKVVV